MNKPKKLVWLFIGIILMSTVCLVSVYLMNRSIQQPGSVEIKTEEKSMVAELNRFQTQLVEGSIVNGKGEETRIQGQGIAVSDFLNTVGITSFTKIKVTADDAYSAELIQEETEKDAFFLIEEGKMDLVVFSDTNRKRNVTNIVLVEIS